MTWSKIISVNHIETLNIQVIIVKSKNEWNNLACVLKFIIFCQVGPNLLSMLLPNRYNKIVRSEKVSQKP